MANGDGVGQSGLGLHKRSSIAQDKLHESSFPSDRFAANFFSATDRATPVISIVGRSKSAIVVVERLQTCHKLAAPMRPALFKLEMRRALFHNSSTANEVR
jgi:hypothetical protein